MRTHAPQRWIAPVLVGVALLVRLPGLTRPEVGDEGPTVAAMARPVSDMAGFLVTHDAHPPLYFMLLHGWGLVSHAFWWLRIFSVLLGAAACFLIYKIGADMFNEEVGRFAALFAALSPLLIFISQYLRPYAMAVALSCATVWLAGRLLKTAAPRAFAAHLAAITLLIIAGLYTYYPTAFFMAGVYLFLLGYFFVRNRRKLAGCAVSAVVALLAYAPWLASYSAQMAGVSSGTSSSTPLLKHAGMGFYLGPVQVGAMAKAFLALFQFDELHTLAVRFSGHYPPVFLGTMIALVSVAVVLLLLAGWWQLRVVGRVRAFVVLLLVVSVLPPLASAVMSAAGDLGWLPPIAVNLRYFGESAAIATLLLAGGLLGIRPRRFIRPACLAVSVLFAAQLPYIYQYPFNDQASILRVMASHPDVTLVVSAPRSVEGFLDGSHRETFRTRYESIVLSQEQLEPAMARIAQHPRFCFFQVTTAEWMIQFAPLAQAFDELAQRYGYSKMDERQISDVLQATVYQRRSAS